MTKKHPDSLDLDIDRVNFSRIFNYWLGGYHNFENDRITADRIESMYPFIRKAAFANRSFLRRCIRYLSQQNIHQFLDIGSGIQTNGGVFEFLSRLDATAKIVLVDVDPVVVQHNKTMLENENNALNIYADCRNVDSIFQDANVKNFIDFSKPVAVMLSNILHYISDDQIILGIIADIKASISMNSFLVIEHLSLPDQLKRVLTKTKKITEPLGMQIKSRSHAEIYKFFHGFELVQPGLVFAPLWRGESEFDALVDFPERSVTFVGVGQKKWGA